jgi:hypothetical protein
MRSRGQLLPRGRFELVAGPASFAHDLFDGQEPRAPRGVIERVGHVAKRIVEVAVDHDGTDNLHRPMVPRREAGALTQRVALALARAPQPASSSLSTPSMYRVSTSFTPPPAKWPHTPGITRSSALRM